MRFLVLFLMVVALSGCGDKVVVDDGLVRSPAVELGGASVRSAVLAMKGVDGVQLDRIKYKAQTGELDGPFRWTIEARADAGVAEWMVVHQVKIETRGSRRAETYPASLLGKRVAFVSEEVETKKEKVEESGEEEKRVEVVARYMLPGVLQIYPKADGVVSVIALVEIGGPRGMKDWVKFSMAPGATKAMSFRFLPSVVEVGGAPVEVPEIPGAVVEPDVEMAYPLPDAEFPLPVQ